MLCVKLFLQCSSGSRPHYYFEKTSGHLESFSLQQPGYKGLNVTSGPFLNPMDQEVGW